MKLALFSLLLCFSAWAKPERIKYVGDITVNLTTADVHECRTDDGKKLKALIQRSPQTGPNGVVRDWGFPVAVGTLAGNEFSDIPGSRIPEMGIEIAQNGRLDFVYSKSTPNGSERFNVRCQLEPLQAPRNPPERIKYWGDITLDVKPSEVYECVKDDGKKLKAIIKRHPDIGPGGVVNDWALPIGVGTLAGNEFTDIKNSSVPEMGIEISPSGRLDFAYSIRTTNGWNRFNLRCQLEQIEAYRDRLEGKELNSPHSPQSQTAGSTSR